MSSDEPSNQIEHSEAVERYEAVTDLKLIDFLNEKAPDALCSYCGKAEYIVPVSPSGESAALVSAPVPNSKGLGAWLYMAFCPLCGHTNFFHAHVVTTLMDEGN